MTDGLDPASMDDIEQRLRAAATEGNVAELAQIVSDMVPLFLDVISALKAVAGVSELAADQITQMGARLDKLEDHR